MVGQATDQMV